jgi:hypothetical protein
VAPSEPPPSVPPPSVAASPPPLEPPSVPASLEPELLPELLPELEPELLPELDPELLPELEPLELPLSVAASSPVGGGELDEELHPVPMAKARPRPSEATKKVFEFCIGKSPLLGRSDSRPTALKRSDDFQCARSLCNVREHGHLSPISP